MECAYKKVIDKNKDGECGLTYPECTKQVICFYEEKYHDLLMDAKAVERELAEERGEDETY